ncbi:MAG TPA: pilin [Herminiimonas sp.]|jgi:Tfp pilus assembly protein PilE|nr:pilin [Herminiimonas sp.]
MVRVKLHGLKSQPQGEKMFCSQCGHSNDALARHCQICNADLQSAPSSNNIDDPEAFYKAIIGPKNQAYYLRRFATFDRNGKTGASWHWPSFFVAFYWLLYRKMWLGALIYFVAPYVVAMALGIMAAIAGKSGIAVIGIGYLLYAVAIFLIMPIYASAFYYKFCNAKIAEARASSRDVQRQLGELSAKGGTSYVVFIIVGLLTFVSVIGILAAIAIPQYQQYVTRAKVAEAHNVANRAAKSVGNFYEEHRQIPNSLAEAGFTEPLPLSIRNIALARNAVLSIEMSATNGPVAGKSFTLQPADDNGHVIWTCSSAEIPDIYLPLPCRQKK